MLIDEIKGMTLEKEVLEKELREEKRKVGKIIAEGGKEVARLGRDLAKVKEEKDRMCGVVRKI